MKLSNVPEAYKKLTNNTLETSKIYKNLQNGTNSFISYPEFCLLVAENFTSDGYDIYTADGRVYFSANYWACALLKTRYLIKRFVVNPVNNAIGISLVWICSFFFNQFILIFINIIHILI